MIILSYNCWGLASPSKKSSLKRMVDMYGPSIILLQETMGLSEKVKKVLEGYLPGWTFEAVMRWVDRGDWKLVGCRGRFGVTIYREFNRA